MKTEEAIEAAFRRGFQHGVEAAIDLAQRDATVSAAFYERLVRFQNGPVTEFREHRGPWSRNARSEPPHRGDMKGVA